LGCVGAEGTFSSFGGGAGDGGEIRLVQDGLVVADDIWKIRAEGSVDGNGEGRLELGNVWKGNARCCKERRIGRARCLSRAAKNDVDLEGG